MKWIREHYQSLIKGSTKRTSVFWTTFCLIAVVLGIGGCIAYRIKVAGEVGLGAVGAFTAVTVFSIAVAALTGHSSVNYRKPEAEQK